MITAFIMVITITQRKRPTQIVNDTTTVPTTLDGRVKSTRELVTSTDTTYGAFHKTKRLRETTRTTRSSVLKARENHHRHIWQEDGERFAIRIREKENRSSKGIEAYWMYLHVMNVYTHKKKKKEKKHWHDISVCPAKNGCGGAKTDTSKYKDGCGEWLS